MDAEETLALLESLSNQQESRITEGEFWTMAKVPPVKLKGLLAGIIGFELAIEAWRPTFKLSQNVPAEDRERLAAGLEAEGSPAIAQLMRTLAP